MMEALSNPDVEAAYCRLVQEIRTGVLLTMRNGRPFGSHVPYILGTNWTRAYLHLSRLALHTQHLLQDTRVSLFVSEADQPGKNPLALRRMNVLGSTQVLSPDLPSYAGIKEQYLARFPQAAMMFGFGDFALWELQLEEAHLVLGFGQAYQSFAEDPSRWIHQKPEAKK